MNAELTLESAFGFPEIPSIQDERNRHNDERNAPRVHFVDPQSDELLSLLQRRRAEVAERRNGEKKRTALNSELMEEEILL